MLVAASSACWNESDGSPGTGGSFASGGRSGSGGTSASGGTITTGGTASGGDRGSGGSSASGGTAGGGAGGWAKSGGTTGSGGSTTGGTTSAGGTTATGGAVTGGARTGGTAGTTAGGAGGAGTDGGGGLGGSGGTSTGAGGARPDGGGGDGRPDAGDAGGAFQPCPTTAGTACAIMPIGDSITEGCCTAPMGGYRIELYHQVLTNKKNLTFVGTASPNGPETVDNQPFPKQHEGHGGYTISQIAGLADKAIASSKPDIVLLKIGTNDINNNVDVAKAPDRLASLIDQITKDVPSALLVVSAIIPTNNDGTNQRVQTYNTAIKGKVDSAAAAGKHVVFLDNYAAFAQNASYKTALMADGLHPNTAGYVVLGQSFYKAISNFLPAKP